MYKTLPALAVFLCFSFFANAQFTKGDILLGGNLSFGSSKSTSQSNPNYESKSTSGNFNISLGKAVRENSVFGLYLNYQPRTNSYFNGAMNVKDELDSYGIGIFYRRYKNLGKEFYLFGEAGGGYNGYYSSTKDSAGNKLSTANSNGGMVYISPGIAYKVSKKLFIELSIPQLFSANYSSSKTKNGSITTATNKNFSAGVNLNSNPLDNLGFGFRLIL